MSLEMFKLIMRALFEIIYTLSTHGRHSSLIQLEADYAAFLQREEGNAKDSSV